MTECLETLQVGERAYGAMAGLALGDALGMPTPKHVGGRIRRYYGGSITTLMDAVPQQPIAPNMKAGAVTDDTEQAFVLGTSAYRRRRQSRQRPVRP